MCKLFVVQLEVWTVANRLLQAVSCYGEYLPLVWRAGE